MSLGRASAWYLGFRGVVMIIDCSGISMDEARLAVSVLNSELLGKDSCGFDVYPFGFDSKGHVVTSARVYEPYDYKTLSDTYVSTLFRCVCKGIDRAWAKKKI